MQPVIAKKLFLSAVAFFGFAACVNQTNRIAANTPTDRFVGGFEIKGISLVATVNQLDSGVMNDIKNANANFLALMPYAFCSIERPEVQFDLDHQWWGERTGGIIATIQAAHKAGLNTMLKPHLWIAKDGLYTGELLFDSEKEWETFENSFSKYILHFAKIAEENNVEIFCLATEMRESIRLRPGYWKKLIFEIRQQYHGKLTYAANWDDYTKVPFWSDLDFIGIDAYFPLSFDAEPGVKGLQAAWKKYQPDLEKLSVAKNKKVLFTEYGYRNSAYCAAKPWTEAGSILSDAAQRNAYEGFFRAFQAEKWFAGGFAWKWHGDTHEMRTSKIDYTPQGKPALKILKAFYAN